MIDVNKARRDTVIAIESRYKEFLQEVNDRIESAVANCQTNCTFASGKLDSTMIKYLEYKGFKVDHCSYPDEWLVSWRWS